MILKIASATRPRYTAKMDKPRWHYRFENFERAFGGLAEAVARQQRGELDDLAQAGLIQRFEYSWELAWKVLRDYLADVGNPLPVPSPINVIRAAFEINLIDDGDAWVVMMKARNAMAHEYDGAAAVKTVNDICADYFVLLTAVKGKLEAERAAGN